MNKDAVRINQIDLPMAFPSVRLLESLRGAWSIPCLMAAVFAFAGSRIHSGTSSNGDSLELTSAVSPFVPSAIEQIILNAETLAVFGSSRGPAASLSLIIHMFCVGFGAVGISRFIALVVNRQERSGVLRTAIFCFSCWKPILVSTSLASVIGLMGLLVFRAAGKVTVWFSGVSGAASIPNIAFWLSSLMLWIVLFVLLAGWLLGLSAMAIDRVDGAEALSRGISYVLSRFRRTVSFAIIIGVIAKLVGLATWMCVTTTGKMAFRSISENPNSPPELSAGFESFRMWVVEAVQFSTVCCGLAIAYLILRQVIDNVDFREIYDQK
jgi:hypothetical protein